MMRCIILKIKCGNLNFITYIILQTKGNNHHRCPTGIVRPGAVFHRVEYESTTFFEVNTHFKYFSVDKPLSIF